LNVEFDPANNNSEEDFLSPCNGNKFTTKDVDNDIYDVGNCGIRRGGGWWFEACGASNLNGRNYDETTEVDRNQDGIKWGQDTEFKDTLKTVTMSLMPDTQHFDEFL
jgi:hypothetical protein